MNDYSPDWYSNRKTLLFSFLFAIGIHAALFTLVRHFPVFGKVKVMSPPRLKVRLCAPTPAKAVYDVQQFKPSRFFPEVPPPPKKVVPKRPKKVVKPKAIKKPLKKAIRHIKKKKTIFPPQESIQPSMETRKTPIEEPQPPPAPSSPVPRAETSDMKQSSSSTPAAPPPPKRELAYPDYGKSPGLSYPPLAQRRGFEGRVVLRVLVSKEGRALKVTLAESSGHSILDRAAIKAVKEWVFRPGKLNGVPVDMWVKVPVVYKLR